MGLHRGRWLHLITGCLYVKNNIQFLPDITGKGKKKGREEVVVVVVSIFLVKTFEWIINYISLSVDRVDDLKCKQPAQPLQRSLACTGAAENGEGWDWRGIAEGGLSSSYLHGAWLQKAISSEGFPKSCVCFQWKIVHVYNLSFSSSLSQVYRENAGQGRIRHHARDPEHKIEPLNPSFYSSTFQLS